jgi:IS5 family transposase
MNEHLEHMTNYIAKLAMMPAWIDEMRRWTKELEANESGFYKGLGLKVAERIKSLKEQEKDGGSNERT